MRCISFFMFTSLTTFMSPFERLNLSQEEGKKWIMNPVRQRRMGTDAKIDMEKAPVSLMSNFRYFASKFPLFISIMKRTKAFVNFRIVFSAKLTILLCCY